MCTETGCLFWIHFEWGLSIGISVPYVKMTGPERTNTSIITLSGQKHTPKQILSIIQVAAKHPRVCRKALTSIFPGSRRRLAHATAECLDCAFKSQSISPVAILDHQSHVWNFVLSILKQIFFILNKNLYLLPIKLRNYTYIHIPYLFTLRTHIQLLKKKSLILKKATQCIKSQGHTYTHIYIHTHIFIYTQLCAKLCLNGILRDKICLLKCHFYGTHEPHEIDVWQKIMSTQ